MFTPDLDEFNEFRFAAYIFIDIAGDILQPILTR